MNYLSIYDSLISKRKAVPLSKEVYGEEHHIIPKCMGGSDEKENIVRLTAREHYLAHALLFKHYRTTALSHAWHSMLRRGKGQERVFTSAQYDLARKARAKKLSEEMKGEGNHFYGKHHTPETRLLLSQQRTSKELTAEEKEAWVLRIGARNPKTEEHKKKIGRKGLTMMQNVITLEIVRGKREDYDESLWVNPRKLKPEGKHKCDYCEVVTTKGNLKRWHNEKCKKKR